jgi:hypothetical protein
MVSGLMAYVHYHMEDRQRDAVAGRPISDGVLHNDTFSPLIYFDLTDPLTQSYIRLRLNGAGSIAYSYRKYEIK